MNSEPIERFVHSQRLKIAYWDWGNEQAPPLILVHGGRDHARSWDRIAAGLRDDHHVVAIDLRGHGDSEWSIGSQYGIPDIALDLARLIEHLGAPARVVAHSYGGAISLVTAGTYPELFEALVAIEGTQSLNPREAADGMGPRWLRMWADKVRGFEEQQPHVYPTLEALCERMREANPRLPADFVPDLARYASRAVEGGFVWKYDFWVNGRTAMEIRRDELPNFWAAVTCPVLLLFAAGSSARPGQRHDAERFFQRARTVMVDGVGHWIHHEDPERTIREIKDFLAGIN